MSLYIIEDRYGALRDSSVNYKYAKSLQQSKYPDGHIVEMVPAKPKVQVSQEEADMLEKTKNPTNRPSFMITEYSNSHKGNMLGNDLEDRLMRAYVNGYTVAKETLYNVKVPHSTDGYYWRGISGQVHTYTEPDQHARVLKTDAYIWTQKQIDDADLQDCEKEEVTDDEEARDEC